MGATQSSELANRLLTLTKDLSKAADHRVKAETDVNPKKVLQLSYTSKRDSYLPEGKPSTSALGKAFYTSIN